MYCSWMMTLKWFACGLFLLLGRSVLREGHASNLLEAPTVISKRLVSRKSSVYVLLNKGRMERRVP